MTEPLTLLHGIGANIAAHRRAANITQVELAARIGKSVQWVSAVEQGRRHADRLTDLLRIATVIKCTIEDLIGRPVDSLTPGVHPQRENVAAVRTALLRAPVPTAPSAVSPPSLGEMHNRLSSAWTTWHNSPTAHTALGGVLPSLLADAIAVYNSAEDRRAAARILAGAYQIIRQWLHHIPDADLAWVAADRAMNTAREADDPHLIALGAWALSAPYRRAGHQDEATRLCLAAADELKPLLDNPESQPELFAAYGMLHLAGAISAAQSDEDGRAWALHRVANDTAQALGNRYDPWTVFGLGNVAIHELALHAELGRADAIVDYASRLRIDDVPSVERRARVLIDTARGFVQRGEDEAAILVLLDAEQISTDEVRHSTLVHELLRELLHRDRARARPHVHKLARRVGLIVS
ncbi:MAG: helix-turn-helix domain-containing protein [Pseudonocardiaceae bacterium]